MSELPEQISLPVVELQDWHARIRAAMNPQVEFNHDMEKMKDSAMKEKDKCLYFLNQRLYAFRISPPD